MKPVCKTKTRFGGRRCCLCNAKAPVTLHSFPKGDLQSLWKRICNYESYDDVSRLVICTNHFTRSDYYQPDAKQYGRNPLLRPNRYPSVNVPNKIEPDEEPVSSTSLCDCVIDVTANLECILVEETEPSEPTQLKSVAMLDPLSLTASTIPENTGNLGMIMQTSRKRRFRVARNFGDRASSDMKSPIKLKRMLRLARDKIKQAELITESFRKKNKRLQKKVKSLQDLVNHLKRNRTLSEDTTDTLTV